MVLLLGQDEGLGGHNAQVGTAGADAIGGRDLERDSFRALLSWSTNVGTGEGRAWLNN